MLSAWVFLEFFRFTSCVGSVQDEEHIVLHPQGIPRSGFYFYRSKALRGSVLSKRSR